MEGGVRKRYGSWYYYFDLGVVEGNGRKLNGRLLELKLKLRLNRF